MARRSTSSTRQLVPLEGHDWQDEDPARDAVPADDADRVDDADEAEEADADATIDLDEGDDLAVEDTAVLAAAGGLGDASTDMNVDALIAELESGSTPAVRQAARRTPGGARRQVEDYWERRRVARALEDLEDFEI